MLGRELALTRSLSASTGHLTDDLSDRYFRLLQQHQQLKLQCGQLSEENRRLRGSLLRAQRTRNITPSTSLAQIMKVDTLVRRQADQLAEVQAANEQLVKQNRKLADALLLARIRASGKIPSTDPYEHVRARVDTGRRNTQRSVARSVIQKERKDARVSFSAHVQQRHFSQDEPALNGTIGDHLLQEARSEIAKLEQIVLMQQSFIERSITREKEPSEPDALSSLESSDEANQEMVAKYGKKSDKSREISICRSVTPPPGPEPEGRNTPSDRTLSPKPEAIELAECVDRLRTQLHEQRQQSGELRLQLMHSKLDGGAMTQLNTQLQQVKVENEILRQSLEQLSTGDGGDELRKLMRLLQTNEEEKSFQPSTEERLNAWRQRMKSAQNSD